MTLVGEYQYWVYKIQGRFLPISFGLKKIMIFFENPNLLSHFCHLCISPFKNIKHSFQPNFLFIILIVHNQSHANL